MIITNSLAEMSTREVDVVHCWLQPMEERLRISSSSTEKIIPNALNQTRRRHRRWLKHLIKKTMAEDITYRIHLIKRKPYKLILDFARKHQILNLDSEGLESIYDRAAIDLTRTGLLRNVIVPLFKEIGKLWHGGSLKIINEHMATIITRTFLLNILRTIAISDSAPRIVVATTLGQWHDVGALTVALTASENGWYPVYYGPNLPAEEIALATKHSGARAVAISITHLLNQHYLVIELRRLGRYIGQDVTLFVGGRVVGDHTQVLEEVNAKYINDIEQFSEELNSLLIVNVG